MKNKLKTLLFFTLLSHSLWSQSTNYFPFKIGNENFSIGSYMYKSRTQLSTINIDQKYSIINDSIIFTFNNEKRKIYISTDYGDKFNSTNYSDFFGSLSNTFYIEKLLKENDKVFIVMFPENESELINKVFIYDTKNPESKEKYLFSSLAQNNQIVTLKLSFNNILIGNSNDNIYQWKNNKWEIINIPAQNYIIESFVSEDYFYAFFSDKIRGKNNLNNSCYRTKDLNNWEKIENFTFKYGQFHLSTIFENKIFFNKKFIFDLNSKQLIKDNFITQKFSDSIHDYDFNINVCNDKLYICDTHEFPRVKLFKYENNELNEILTLNTDCRAYKFYYSNKFGIFGDNGIYFFDNKLIARHEKRDKKPKVLAQLELKGIVNNEVNSECLSKIAKSNEIPSYSDYLNFKLRDDDIEQELCNNSSVKVVELFTSTRQKKGYRIYYFSTSGKRIKDEFLDSKNRVIGQYIYEYTSQNKGKYMYRINYLGEIFSLRVVEQNEIVEVSFEKPFPRSKEKAIARYKMPQITQFTDKCQTCKGSGYNINYTHRCMVCNGAGSIAHRLVKY